MHDVIVVGAGPAGSTTARECAETGMSVLLLDKAEFPRDKPCGGGVTKRASDLLPFDISPVVERTISSVRFNCRHHRCVTRESDRVLVYATQRRNLDAFLVDRAQAGGVKLRERTHVREVSLERDHVSVGTSDGTFQGRALVAADGCKSQTARLAGLRTNFGDLIAIEGNIYFERDIPTEWKSTIGLHLGWLKGGYGWIFPKANHLNIGVAGWKYNGPKLRESLARLARFYGYDPEAVEHIKGCPVPLRNLDSPVERGRVLVVGDAAGLVDPISAEGIHSAIWSGMAAARSLKRFIAGETPDLSEYRRELESELIPSISVSQQYHDICHFWPGLVVNLEVLGKFLVPGAFRIVGGELSFRELRDRNKRFSSIVELISNGVRSAPPLRRIAGIPGSIGSGPP